MTTALKKKKNPVFFYSYRIVKTQQFGSSQKFDGIKLKLSSALVSLKTDYKINLVIFFFKMEHYQSITNISAKKYLHIPIKPILRLTANKFLLCQFEIRTLN